MKQIQILLLLVAMIIISGCSVPFVSNNNDNSNIDTTQEATMGVVTINSSMVRGAGSGSCGVYPWSKDCTTYRVWWGMNLEANSTSRVLIIPDGEDRWVITNNADVVKDYPQYSSLFTSTPSGRYTTATIDFSATDGCSGTISAGSFNMQIMGVRVYDNLKLIFSPDATENITGSCGSIPLNYTQTNWRWDTAMALSGNADDMTAILFSDDYKIETSLGTYQHTYEIDTNPSPENRDHVKASVSMYCIGADDVQTNCPWDK